MNLYKVIKAIFKYPLMLIFGIRVIGREKIPEDGGFLLCSNHTSMADVILIAVAMRRQPRYMAKKEALSVPLAGAFLRALGAFSVDRGGADIGAVKKAITIIEEGGVVSIFPQGHRYPGVAVRSTPVRHGAGLIAYRASCGALPVYIKTKTGKVKPFCRNEVIIGDLIPNDSLGFSEGGSAEYRRASEIIFDHICDLGVEYGAPLEVSAAESLGADAVRHAYDTESPSGANEEPDEGRSE